MYSINLSATKNIFPNSFPDTEKKIAHAILGLQNLSQKLDLYAINIENLIQTNIKLSQNIETQAQELELLTNKLIAANETLKEKLSEVAITVHSIEEQASQNRMLFKKLSDTLNTHLQKEQDDVIKWNTLSQSLCTWH